MCSSGPDYVEQSEYERELIRQSEKLWNQYNKNYVPLQNQVIEQIQGKRGAGFKQHSQNKAVNAARMQAPGTVMLGAGMQPGSGNMMQASNQAQQQSGTSGAVGAVSGLQSAEDQYMSGMMGMSQTGRGQQATAMSGYNQLATAQLGADIGNMASKQQRRANRSGTLGSLAGMGMGIYGRKKDWW